MQYDKNHIPGFFKSGHIRSKSMVETAACSIEEHFMCAECPV